MTEARLLIPSVALVVTLAGCAGPERGERGLSALPEAELPEPETVSAESAERVAERYRQALEFADDPVMRLDIRWRLADLSMDEGERAMAEADTVGPQFDEAIARYESLLEDYRAGNWPERLPEPDPIYYQLAKAYALDGRLAEADRTLAQLAERFPDSPYYDEAQFRRAERAFSEGEYDRAEALYRELVPGAAQAANFSRNALYMRAWAQFKQGDYPEALESFASVLDHLLPEEGSPAALDVAWQALPDAQAEVAGDALRAMALSFAYLEGPPSIRALLGRIGPRSYEHRLYRRLAERYREQERYRDAAQTYAQFVRHNPRSDLAPVFSLSRIETYREGRFPGLVRAGKQAFVRQYGLLSRYWFERGGRPGEPVSGSLKQFLPELANFQHARAQRLEERGEPEAVVRTAYVHAATWYREFVASFPDAPERAEQQFLLAEVLNRAQRWPEALGHYEQVAFEIEDPERGREAGYAAVLLSGRLADAAAASEEQGDSLERWRARRLADGRAFARHYPEDPRATGVLSQLAREQLELGALRTAAELAQTLIDWQPPATAGEQFSAWLVLGHSRFDLEQYADAETAYWQVLETWPAEPTDRPGTPTRAEVRERIAASIYRRAEAELEAGRTAQAVPLLRRIPSELPATAVAEQAQFDLGHYLTQLERWEAARVALERFRRDYPDSPLQSQIPARLAEVYRAQENWLAAADELRRLEQISDDPALRREALYTAAELYRRGEAPERAIESFRRYAHTYAEPAPDRREAEYQLTELYRERGEVDKRNFWLRRLKEGHNPDNARSTYLAAFAASELAEQSYNEFARIELGLPLDQSLERKRAALERALGDQEEILDYGVREFSTRASHRMAAIYHQLSRDLMNSQRPEGLSALELEQYDILLEEQAIPFEDKAIELYEINAHRTRRGVYDDWVEESFEALAEILPARYGKEEKVTEVSRGIH